MANNELDVRRLPQPDKQPTTLATYVNLPVGESFVLVNNRDPKHLHEEFEADYPGSYRWEYVEKGPTVWRIRISKLTTTPLPRALTNTSDIAEPDAQQDTARVIRKPNVGDCGLDWNVVTLAPSGEADTATGVDVDVLIHVLSGSGRLVTDKGTIPLAPGAQFWLPRRSRPQFSASPDGLRYLAVNQKWDILPP